MFWLGISVYGTVLTGELVGDKLLYSVLSLSRLRHTGQVFIGLSLAYALKTMIAVYLGGLFRPIPTTLLSVVSALVFFAMALALLLKNAKGSDGQGRHGISAHPFVIAFTLVFFSEWGDVGQITAATLSARYAAPVLVAIATIFALITKSAVALALGNKLQGRISDRWFRVAAVAMNVVLGIVSLTGALSQSS